MGCASSFHLKRPLDESVEDDRIDEHIITRRSAGRRMSISPDRPTDTSRRSRADQWEQDKQKTKLSDDAESDQGGDFEAPPPTAPAPPRAYSPTRAIGQMSKVRANIPVKTTISK
jgi:hypothetical protein